MNFFDGPVKPVSDQTERNIMNKTFTLTLSRRDLDELVKCTLMASLDFKARATSEANPISRAELRLLSDEATKMFDRLHKVRLDSLDRIEAKK